MIGRRGQSISLGSEINICRKILGLSNVESADEGQKNVCIFEANGNGIKNKSLLRKIRFSSCQIPGKLPGVGIVD